MIAEGRTAEIYAWQPGWLLKLYRDWVPSEDAAHEARVTQAAHAIGFAAPATGDIVEINGRTGLIMEHIQGPDMLAAMLQKPWRVDRFAHMLAKLHLQMHVCRPSNLPDLHQRLAARLQVAPGLNQSQRDALLSRLEQLPAGNALCHGDLHPLNVILNPDGLKVIDWVDAKCGNPLADVARSTVLFTVGGPPESPIHRLFVFVFRSRFHEIYLKTYFASQPEAREQYQQWLPIVAAARLTEGIEADHPYLLAAVDRWL